MTDSAENIEEFFANMPEEFNMLEEGIDIQTQMEYVTHSHSFEYGELTEKEMLVLSRILFDPKTDFDNKKKVLTLLAHLGTVLAYREIEKYYKHPDDGLKPWASLALQECKMLLETSLTDNSVGFISSGLGGTKDKLRIYFIVLPLTEQVFTQAQRDIVKSEFEWVCKSLDSPIEAFDFAEEYISFTALVSFDVAIDTIMTTGIQKCNELGNFVFEHYYATNQNIPDKKEIDEVIKIVRGD